MAEKPTLKRAYHIPLNMFMDAFSVFQRKYVFPQNTVLSVILLAIAGVYVRAVMKDNSKTIAYLVIVFCVAFVMSVWYRALKMRRSLREALKEVENDIYEVQLFSDKLTIRTEDAPPPPVEESEDKPAEIPAEVTEGGDGFQPIFPEAPAEPAESIPPTEIYFDDRVKFHDLPDYFMIYLVKRNFYLIPKKDFSDSELSTIRKCFTK